MKLTELKNLIESTLQTEIKKRIINESKKQVFHIKCEGEPVATFDTEEEANEELPKYKKSNPDKELIIEPEVYESHSDMIDKLDEMGEELEEKENQNMEVSEFDYRQSGMYDHYDEIIDEVKDTVDRWLEIGKINDQEHYGMYFDIDSEDLDWPEDRGVNVTKRILISLVKKHAPQLLVKKKKENQNMENQEPMEGNSFAYKVLLAKKEGKKEFEHDGKTHDVEESWKQLEEEEAIGEEFVGEEGECQECGDQSMSEGGEDDYLDSAYEDRTYIDDEPSNYDNEGEFEDDGTCDMCGGTGVGSTPDQDCPACHGNGYVKRKEEDDSDYTGDDLFETKGMCSECGEMLNEEGMCMECGSGYMKESKKKVLRLKESELVKLISKMVSESVPGLEVTKKAQSATKKETNDYVGSVQKKMKDYLSIPGNDNPEFPKQVGKGEKAAVHFDSKEDQEYVDNYRGNSSLDLDYDSEPSEKFKKRLKNALEGDSTMGNSQDAGNVVKTDTGKKLAKIADIKKKDEKTFPMYKKDSQPTTSNKVNESKVSFSNVLKEEVEKMKKLSTYNKKTQ